MTDYANHIAMVMKERRTALDLSLQAVADRSGLTKSHIWEMENGRARNPTLNAMVSISRALGVSLDYLTGLSNSVPDLHPEALRIAVEVDALLRRKAQPGEDASAAPTVGLVPSCLNPSSPGSQG